MLATVPTALEAQPATFIRFGLSFSESLSRSAIVTELSERFLDILEGAREPGLEFGAEGALLTASGFRRRDRLRLTDEAGMSSSSEESWLVSWGGAGSVRIDDGTRSELYFVCFGGLMLVLRAESRLRILFGLENNEQ